ncbi:CLUMA_CG017619, isoform A [Clunio marinus]|nr:CLUMA_CG017619, isoform A [Clunio marinus]
MYDRNVRTELCDDSRLIGYQRNACLKIVTFEFGNRKTLRQCARVGPRKDPCFEQGNAYDLSVCEVCDNHLCNGSTNLKKNIWIMSLPVLGIMFYKIMMM